MILQDQYNELREVVLDLMVKAAMKRNESLQNQQNHLNNNNHADDAHYHVTAKSDLDFAFGGFLMLMMMMLSCFRQCQMKTRM